MVFDRQGDLYGTTSSGGSASDGTVLELAPNGSGGYAESTLYSFVDMINGGPGGGLTCDGQGNLYGTTENGGTTGWGAVFEIQ